MLALDMDGTLLNDRMEISAENQKWIASARENGITVMLATGRGMQSVRPYLETLRLDAPLVLANGSEVWKSPTELLTRHTLDRDLVEKLRKLAMWYDVWFWSYSTQGPFNRGNWERADFERAEWLKFGFQTEDPDKLRRLKEEAAALAELEITNSSPMNIELNPKGVSKASGIRKVCDLLGIAMSEVVAVGDSLNDLAMIREAGLGVAMGNAQEEVKRAANAVTSSNLEDGVARVIRTYLLGNR